VGILNHYFKKKSPLTLKTALDECIMQDSERSKAFIYKRYYGYLMAVALRYLKEEMEAEDVINEAFVKVFRKIPDFQSHEDESILEKAFKGWIARITVNTCIDKLRGKRDVLLLDEVSDQDLHTHAVPIATSLEEKDILKLLYELPEIQRTIFNLYEIEGYSHEEISKDLNIPESTSRTYLTRAKSKLRKLYQQEFELINKVY